MSTRVYLGTGAMYPLITTITTQIKPHLSTWSAQILNGATSTLWQFWWTHCCTQFHQGLIIITRSFWIHCCICKIPVKLFHILLVSIILSKDRLYTLNHAQENIFLKESLLWDKWLYIYQKCSTTFWLVLSAPISLIRLKTLITLPSTTPTLCKQKYARVQKLIQQT